MSVGPRVAGVSPCEAASLENRSPFGDVLSFVVGGRPFRAAG